MAILLLRGLLFLLLSMVPSYAYDVWLSAPNEATMATALTPLLQYGGKSDYSDRDYDDTDFGGVLYPDFTYGGRTADGGSWGLEVKGQIVSPTPQVTAQPYEPGNFTNRTGLPIQPEIEMQRNNRVGVEDPVYGPTAFWVLIHWNSNQPMPSYAAHGLTVSTKGPYSGHF